MAELRRRRVRRGALRGLRRHYRPIHAPEIAWWTLALLVLITERWPVELEFRRLSHSFSLTDVPLTPALIFASGTGALVAIFLGTLVALGLCRHPPVKFAFNVAQFSLVTAVLLMVIHTGYSSLSYLRNLPLDTLKIAREFVDGLAFSDHDAAFVRLIVGLDKTVGLKVVAEGIETRALLDMLREIGCEFGQGYYFARPMDGDAD